MKHLNYFSTQSPIRNFLYLLFTSYFLLLISCEKSATELPPPAGPDTTSHHFTWQIDTLGKLTSKLSDIFAISENNIWAVGEIFIQNSNRAFGVAHWNGQIWELDSIIVQGPTHPSNLRPRGVFAFNSAEIWFASGGVHFFDGQTTESFWINSFPGNPNSILEPEQSAEKLWGTSSANLWIVGINGAIAFFDGNQWQKQESNTTISLLDVYGKSNGSEIWTCGYTSNFSESILLRYDGTQWQAVWQWNFQQGSSDSTYEGLLQSLWIIDSDSLMVVGGEGVYRQDIQGNSPPRKENLTLGAFPNCVRGSAPNNIFIVGFDGMVWHYNGATWKTYPELRNPNWVFRSVAVLENKMVAVGLDYSQGIQRDIILTGVRP